MKSVNPKDIGWIIPPLYLYHDDFSIEYSTNFDVIKNKKLNRTCYICFMDICSAFLIKTCIP